MRTALFCLAALVVIYAAVRAIAPAALQQNNRPASADISHPPTTYGSSAIIPTPPAPGEAPRAGGR